MGRWSLRFFVPRDRRNVQEQQLTAPALILFPFTTADRPLLLNVWAEVLQVGFFFKVGWGLCGGRDGGSAEGARAQLLACWQSGIMLPWPGLQLFLRCRDLGSPAA